MQADMFRAEDLNLIMSKVEKVEKSSTQVRRGLFARHTAHDKRINFQDDRLEAIERELYNIKLSIYGNKVEPMNREEKVLSMGNG